MEPSDTARTSSTHTRKFWTKAKRLSQKKTVEFSALTIGGEINRDLQVIVQNLEEHFIERHAVPNVSSAVPLAKEAKNLLEFINQADVDDIELVIFQSDLQFSEQKVTESIRALKLKNSTGLEHISNKMVRLLPTHYHKTLTEAYNKLFEVAHWGKE